MLQSGLTGILVPVETKYRNKHRIRAVLHPLMFVTDWLGFDKLVEVLNEWPSGKIFKASYYYSIAGHMEYIKTLERIMPQFY